jgi:hypothetical protein
MYLFSTYLSLVVVVWRYAVVVSLEYDRTVRWNSPDRLAWSRTVCAYASDLPRCTARAPAPAPWSALAPSAGGRDGHLKSLPSIGSLLDHHFPARNFMIPISFSCVADDYLCLCPYRLCLAEPGSSCPQNRSCSSERAPCPPAFPEISIVLR